MGSLFSTSEFAGVRNALYYCPDRKGSGKYLVPEGVRRVGERLAGRLVGGVVLCVSRELKIVMEFVEICSRKYQISDE